MHFMEADRSTCDALLPGLRQQLVDVPLTDLEAEDSPAIGIFRSNAGQNLLVPKEYGGIGAIPLDAARVVRALGSVAPSMTVATMMHHFSISMLVAVADALGEDGGLGKLLFEPVVACRLLVASGFAEGRTNQGILTPTMKAVPVDGGYLVSGSKKPCSLSRSMDLLTASVDVESAMGLLMLPANTPGMSVHPFWSSFALAGAQSHEVRLSDVLVSEEQIIRPTAELADHIEEVQAAGLIWFQLMVCAAYTGIASALVERALRESRGTRSDRAGLAVTVESAAQLTEGLARRLTDDGADNSTLAAALVTRFAVQDAIARAVTGAVELLGGMAYLRAPDIAYFAAASHAIAFHPPSRTSMAAGLADYFAGKPLVMP